MKSQTLISDFSAGELSPRIFTRGFSDKYASGLEECTNFTILPQGGAFKTPGFQHVIAAYAVTATRGVQFSMAHENTIDIDLEFGNLYCRIIKDGTVINAGANLTTPYVTADLNELQFAQDENVVYIVHPDYAPRKITRTTDASWAIATITFTDIPLHDFNDASSPSPSPSTFTLTEGGTWAAGDTFTLRIDGQYTTAPIAWASSFATLRANIYNGINDALTLYELVLQYGYPDFAVNETTDPEMAVVFANAWAWISDVEVASINSTSGTLTEGGAAGTGRTEVVWSATRGWPRTVALHEQRLVLGGTTQLPAHLWGSATGSPAVFTIGVNDADAFQYVLKGGRHGVAIEWLESKRLLMIGTSSGEYVQHEVPLTPSSVQMLRHTARKSAYLQPAEIDSELFYVQRGKRRLRRFAFEDASQNWQTVDATFLAEHMPNQGIRQIGYAEAPDSVLYAVTEDDLLICMTYDRGNQVAAWWRRVTAADVLSAWTIHNPTTGMDEIHAIVEYASSRYLWKLRATSERVLFDVKSGAGIVRHQKLGNYGGYLDGFKTQSTPGSPTTAITGLPWADGTVVSVVGDDARQADKTVTSGAITAASAAEFFVVGLPYTAKLKTLPLEGGNPGGTSQARKRRFARPHLRLVDSMIPLVNGSRPADRPVNAPMDASAPLTNGDIPALNLGHGEGAQLTIEADLPFPCQITGIFGDIEVGGG